MMSEATAIIISSIISALASAGLSLGSLYGSEKAAADIQRKIDEQKVSDADIIQMISKIEDKAKVLGAEKSSKLSKRLNGIINHYSISSGESEAVLRPIKARLSKLSEQVSKLNSQAELASERAERSMAAYSGYSQKEKSKALNLSKAGQREKELIKKFYKLSPKEQLELAKLNKQLNNGEVDRYQKGDYRDTMAGRTLKDMENAAKEAADAYTKISELTENHM